MNGIKFVHPPGPPPVSRGCPGRRRAGQPDPRRIRYADGRGDGNGSAGVARNRSELDSILDELERELPMLLQDTDDQEDFLMAFAALSDAIEDNTDPEDLPYVRQRIDQMLSKHGVNTGGVG